MTTLRLVLAPRPTLIAKVAPHFTKAIVAGTGIGVSYTAPTYTISLDEMPTILRRLPRLDRGLPLVLRELSRPTEPHTTILGALAALASARSDQA
jgi:hypothetical protein